MQIYIFIFKNNCKRNLKHEIKKKNLFAIFIRIKLFENENKNYIRKCHMGYARLALYHTQAEMRMIKWYKMNHEYKKDVLSCVFKIQ